MFDGMMDDMPEDKPAAVSEPADSAAMKQLLREYIDEELRGGLPYDRYSKLTTRAMKLLGMTAPPPLLEQWRKELGIAPASGLPRARGEGMNRELFQVELWCGVAGTNSYWIVADSFDEAVVMARKNYPGGKLMSCCNRGFVCLAVQGEKK